MAAGRPRTKRCYNGERIIEHVYQRSGYENKVIQVFNPFKLVGRNDQCPCESGKKYKRCHG